MQLSPSCQRLTQQCQKQLVRSSPRTTICAISTTKIAHGRINIECAPQSTVRARRCKQKGPLATWRKSRNNADQSTVRLSTLAKTVNFCVPAAVDDAREALYRDDDRRASCSARNLTQRKRKHRTRPKLDSLAPLWSTEMMIGEHPAAHII